MVGSQSLGSALDEIGFVPAAKRMVIRPSARSVRPHLNRPPKSRPFGSECCHRAIALRFPVDTVTASWGNDMAQTDWPREPLTAKLCRYWIKSCPIGVRNILVTRAATQVRSQRRCWSTGSNSASTMSRNWHGFFVIPRCWTSRRLGDLNDERPLPSLHYADRNHNAGWTYRTRAIASA